MQNAAVGALGIIKAHSHAARNFICAQEADPWQVIDQTIWVCAQRCWGRLAVAIEKRFVRTNRDVLVCLRLISATLIGASSAFSQCYARRGSGRFLQIYIGRTICYFVLHVNLNCVAM